MPADVAFLCLPDDAAREDRGEWAENPKHLCDRTPPHAHRTAPDWVLSVCPSWRFDPAGASIARPNAIANPGVSCHTLRSSCS
jgi:hypothetical protein